MRKISFYEKTTKENILWPFWLNLIAIAVIPMEIIYYVTDIKLGLEGIIVDITFYFALFHLFLGIPIGVTGLIKARKSAGQMRSYRLPTIALSWANILVVCANLVLVYMIIITLGAL